MERFLEAPPNPQAPWPLTWEKSISASASSTAPSSLDQRPARTIAVIHSPPQGVGLDVTQDRRQVGSKSVLGFLLETQPALSLHGHIHESPIMTGLWKVHIGATTACQPGQTPVLVELKPGRVKLTLL